MPRWLEENAPSVERTPPARRLNRATDGAPAIVLAKVEERNPACFVKCRIGAGIIWDAQSRGLPGRGMKIIESAVVPDSDARYPSKVRFEGLFNAQGLAA